MLRLHAICVVLALAGCAGDVDDRPAVFSYVWPAIVEPSCTTSGCHSELSATYGVRLDTFEGAYYTLTGHECADPPGPEDAPRNYVAPGHPEYSTLMLQLRGDGRRRMPLDAPLPDPDIELVERWILEGAPCE